MVRLRRPVGLAVLGVIAGLFYYTHRVDHYAFDSLNIRFLNSHGSMSPTVHRLFEQSYAAENPPFLRLTSLSSQCSRTDWNSEVYLQCEEIFAGLTSIMSEVKTCFKMALDLGYNLVIPRMAIRDQESLTEYNRDNEDLHLPFADWFDEEHLIARLNLACPQMKIARLKTDRQPDLQIGEVLDFDLTTLPYYSGWGLYAWAGNDWNKIIRDNITARLPEARGLFGSEGSDKKTVVRIPARMAFYNIMDDASGHDLRVWNELNYLMRIRPGVRTLLTYLLNSMSSIEGMRPYYGIHFRVEKDSTSEWIKSDTQLPRILNMLEEAWAAYGHEGKMNKAAYVACGDQDEVTKLREAGAKIGWIITDKWTLARSIDTTEEKGLVKAIDSLPFDHQGMIDFGILLLSEFFIGLTNSAFSYSIAHARDPRGRYGGPSINRMKDADSRRAASHLFFDGEDSPKQDTTKKKDDSRSSRGAMVLKAIKYEMNQEGLRTLSILDQLLLPHNLVYIPIRNSEEAHAAIRAMKVRGAPAIALVAILALAVELQSFKGETPEAIKFIKEKLTYLVTSRPTAVNLAEAAGRLQRAVEAATTHAIPVYQQTAEAIFLNDLRDNVRIGQHGALHLIKGVTNKFSVLTICNTGSLATSGYGTAYSVIYQLFRSQHLERAFFCETRPYNQGARLTSAEFLHDEIPSTMILDSSVAALLSGAKAGQDPSNIKAILVGADRVANNGDTANKIGTSQLAILAAHFGIPFFVCAPWTTIDLEMESGDQIVVEERAQHEVRQVWGAMCTPDGKLKRTDDGLVERGFVEVCSDRVDVWNPAFDVTPHELISGIVTETGVIMRDSSGSFQLMRRSPSAAPQSDVNESLAAADFNRP